jgi:hypothetical protein
MIHLVCRGTDTSTVIRLPTRGWYDKILVMQSRAAKTEHHTLKALREAFGEIDMITR